MKNLIEAIVVGSAAFILVALLAVLGGTIVFFLWPIAIPAVFPGLIQSGVLAASLTWTEAVALSWICTLLLKSSSSTTVKKN